MSVVGELLPLSPPTVPAGEKPYGVAITPDGKQVLVANRLGESVTVYLRNTSTGALTFKETVACGFRACRVVVSPDGKHVYVSTTASKIVQFSRNLETGVLTGLEPKTVTAGESAENIAISADGADFYCSNNGSASVSQFTRNSSTGQLTAKSPASVSTGSFPNGIVVVGEYVYVASASGEAVYQYKRGSGGKLEALSPASVAAGLSPEGLAASPDGTSVYCANRDSASVSQYKVGAGGKLEALSPASVAAGSKAHAVAVSPDGVSLYCANEGAKTVSQLSRDTGTGKLTALSPATVEAGTEPYGVAVSPDGISVYVNNEAANVSQYARVTEVKVTCADTITISSAAVVAGARARTVADSVSVSDSALRGAQGLVRTTADGVSVSDAVTRGAQALARTTADTVSVGREVSEATVIGPKPEPEPEEPTFPSPTASSPRNPLSYEARDLLTWEALDALPYQGVSFGKILDQHGAWQGSLPLPQMWDPQTSSPRFDWKDATRPGRTALFVDLQGTLVWGGIIWTANYESDDPTHSLKVGATEFGSYFQHRLQAEDYGSESEVGKLWENTGEDPIKIIKRIIEDAQAREAESGAPGYITGSKIPIVVHGPEGSEYDVKVSYPGTSLQTIDSISSTLTAIGYGPGYDFSWDCEYVDGVPAVVLNLYRPKKGRTPEESQIVITGRDTIKWTWPEDATNQATEVVETGSGTGGMTPAYASTNYPGYPLLQKATARTQIGTESLLEQVALGDLALCGWPVVTPTIVLSASLPDTPARERQTLALGEYDVGDEFVFEIDPMEGGGENTDYRFPGGMSYPLRINQWTCTPADKGLSIVQLDCGITVLQYVPVPQPPH